MGYQDELAPGLGAIGSCAATTAGVGSGGGDPALAAKVRECHDAR